MEKCYITRHVLGSIEGWVLEKDGKPLLTPFTEFKDISQWFKDAGLRAGFAQLTNDVIEVTVTEEVCI